MSRIPPPIASARTADDRVAALLDRMTLDEKIGQMCQLDAGDRGAASSLAEAVRAGRVGAILNAVDRDLVVELQRVATGESRLGIPLLVGRDVIHGYRTVFPIPLAQAATFDPELVEAAARVAAAEAAANGINWAFAPMIDITRDPRWGRVAESPGEDPYLAERMADAMVRGLQGIDPSAPGSVAACAKHFAGYGAVESGRDYATTSIPEHELRNVHLRPFRAAVSAGVVSLMTSFSDLNGVPATANDFLLRRVLREEWGFTGFVTSDWDSVRQLAVHGLTGGDRESALAAAEAGVDMEMAGSAFADHLAGLVEAGELAVERIDAAVAGILRVKMRLGLFDCPVADPQALPPVAGTAALQLARRVARDSIVLLRNDGPVLPLSVTGIRSLAVIGPLADEAYEQLGTWVFDGDAGLSVTGLQGIRDRVGGAVDVRFVRALATSRSRDETDFGDAIAAARASDAVVLFLGEESILSGEAHSRADIGLPGAQAALVRAVREAGKPVIAVIMAGRPLTLADIVDEVDAILYAWHPGSMAGAAVADLLFGDANPSGKLPISFPRMAGQVPIYYSQKNSGKPPSPDTVVHIDDIPRRAPQTSLGMTAFHLDAGYEPLWEFGFGLSYASFEYANIVVSPATARPGDNLVICADVQNTGDVAATEVVQLYVRDLVGSVTRPVRELKGFRRVHLEPGAKASVRFELHTDDLAFFGRDHKLIAEPGEFHVWIGGSSRASLQAGFRLAAAD